MTPGDDAFALRPDLLDLTDACAVVATVGTTSSAAVDPVAGLADRVAPRASGSTSTPPTRAPRQSARSSATTSPGWERADSIGVNPHKWLFTPMDCSAFFTRRPEALRDAFSLVPEYLRVSEDVVSLSEYGVPLGRRFRALKLWAVLRCYGREGLQALIREHVRLAALFEGWVARSPAGRSARRATSRSSASGATGRTRRTRRCSSASTRRARSSSRTRGWTTAMSCGSRSATPARPRTTCAPSGTSSGARLRLERPEELEDAPRPGDDQSAASTRPGGPRRSPPRPGRRARARRARERVEVRRVVPGVQRPRDACARDERRAPRSPCRRRRAGAPRAPSGPTAGRARRRRGVGDVDQVRPRRGLVVGRAGSGRRPRPLLLGGPVDAAGERPHLSAQAFASGASSRPCSPTTRPRDADHGAAARRPAADAGDEP